MFRVFGHIVIHRETWAAVEATIADLQRQVSAVQRETMRNTQTLRKLTPPHGVRIVDPPDLPTIAETRVFPLVRAYAPGELRGRVTGGGMPRYPLEGESEKTAHDGE